LMSSSIQSLSCTKRRRQKEEKGEENRNEPTGHASRPHRPQLGHPYLRASECPFFHLGIKHMVVGYY
jgi:hypothetical protein